MRVLMLALALLAAPLWATETAMIPVTAAEMAGLQQEGLALLDVRSTEEFAAGHIQGAINIPLDQLATRLAELPKTDTLIVYCRSGRRAGLAAAVLQQAGFKDLYELEGHILKWQEEQRPLVSGP
jgi:phage shock protein E